jgi:hypothetical protein
MSFEILLIIFIVIFLKFLFVNKRVSDLRKDFDWLERRVVVNSKKIELYKE